MSKSKRAGARAGVAAGARAAPAAVAAPAASKAPAAAAASAASKARKQVAALPVRRDAAGTLWVLLITSRETRRWVIPKGWPMKGLPGHRAAEREALEEAGLAGKIHKRPLGTYLYWKRQLDRFELCSVRVFLFEVARQIESWREQGQREAAWFTVEAAAERVEEAGLRTIIRRLSPRPEAG